MKHKKCDQCQKTKHCKYYHWRFREDEGDSILCFDCKVDLHSVGYILEEEAWRNIKKQQMERKNLWKDCGGYWEMNKRLSRYKALNNLKGTINEVQWIKNGKENRNYWIWRI